MKIIWTLILLFYLKLKCVKNAPHCRFINRNKRNSIIPVIWKNGGYRMQNATVRVTIHHPLHSWLILLFYLEYSMVVLSIFIGIDFTTWIFMFCLILNKSYETSSICTGYVHRTVVNFSVIKTLFIFIFILQTILSCVLGSFFYVWNSIYIQNMLKLLLWIICIHFVMNYTLSGWLH